ncbi:predicted protein [Methanosarcina acetivorans C2A]|uniref:Uncharacterized protein n=1 Tax=Methanosarcina acetivorans (strain ATCC 35395 / DSM 2834 / JCM 12185 / C2A) TaxID=188937 RepID=Q8TTS8_METAC|nr:predicted protein [Methanosarcina acetivorans C2A]
MCLLFREFHVRFIRMLQVFDTLYGDKNARNIYNDIDFCFILVNLVIHCSVFVEPVQNSGVKSFVIVCEIRYKIILAVFFLFPGFESEFFRNSTYFCLDMKVLSITFIICSCYSKSIMCVFLIKAHFHHNSGDNVVKLPFYSNC